MRSAICLVALLASAPAFAGPLDADGVPARASWLVHIDVKALQESTLGQFLIENADELDIELDDLEDIEEEIGVNPREDIYSATIIGGSSENETTVVLEMSTRVEEVIERARQHESYGTVRTDGWTLHKWDDDETTFFYVGDGAVPAQRLVIIARDQMLIGDVLRTRAGQMPSLQDDVQAKHGSSQAMTLPRSGSLIYAFARSMPWIEHDDDEPASMIARRSDRAIVDVREHEGMTSVDISVTMRTQHEATDIAAMLQGAVAFGRMVSRSDPEFAEVMELLNAIAIQADGRNINVSIGGRSDALPRHARLLWEAMD